MVYNPPYSHLSIILSFAIDFTFLHMDLNNQVCETSPCKRTSYGWPSSSISLDSFSHGTDGTSINFTKWWRKGVATKVALFPIGTGEKVSCFSHFLERTWQMVYRCSWRWAYHYVWQKLYLGSWHLGRSKNCWPYRERWGFQELQASIPGTSHSAPPASTAGVQGCAAKPTSPRTSKVPQQHPFLCQYRHCNGMQGPVLLTNTRRRWLPFFILFNKSYWWHDAFQVCKISTVLVIRSLAVTLAVCAPPMRQQTVSLGLTSPLMVRASFWLASY